MMIENKGKLWFYDSGRRFIKEEHAIRNLNREYDVCVYSLTPRDKYEPEYLVIKVAMGGLMDKYLNQASDKIHLIMEILDYNKTDPMGLFNATRYLCSICLALEQVHFFKKEGYTPELITAQEFFSVEVDPASDDPGAKIYLQDKEHFLKKASAQDH